MSSPPPGVGVPGPRGGRLPLRPQQVALGSGRAPCWHRSGGLSSDTHKRRGREAPSEAEGRGHDDAPRDNPLGRKWPPMCPELERHSEADSAASLPGRQLPLRFLHQNLTLHVLREVTWNPG